MSLNRRYKSIVSIIEETRDLDVLKVEEVITSVKVFDKRENMHDEQDKITRTEKAFSSFKIGYNHAVNKFMKGRSSPKWQGHDQRHIGWSQGRNVNNHDNCSHNSNWNNMNGSSSSGYSSQHKNRGNQTSTKP